MFGGIYEYPPQKIRTIAQTLINATAEPRAEKARISSGEKKLCINARGETRIYDLKSLELEEIITFDQLIQAMAKAGAPKPMMRLALQSEFIGMIDPQKTNKIWFITKYKQRAIDKIPIAIFLYDRDEMEIITGPKHPLQIIVDEGLEDDYPAIRLIDPSRIYDPNYIVQPRLGREELVTGHMQKTYPGHAIIAVSINIGVLGISKENPYERARKGLLPGGDWHTLVMKVDEDLHIRRWLWKFEAYGGEWTFDEPDCVTSRIFCWDEDIMLQGSFDTADLEYYVRRRLKEHKFAGWHGVLRLDLDLRPIQTFKTDSFEERIAEEYDIDEKKYLVSLRDDCTAHSPDRKEIVVPVEVEPRFGGEINGMYLFRTDWNGEKMIEVKWWDATDPDIGCFVRWVTWV